MSLWLFFSPIHSIHLFFPNNRRYVPTLFESLRTSVIFPACKQGHQANTPDRSQKVPRRMPQRVKDRSVILLSKTMQKYNSPLKPANR